MAYIVRLRLSDPAGRIPKGVLVEQRIADGFVKLGEVPDSDRVKVTTQETGDLLHHLRVTIEWSDGLVSVSDDVFVGNDKKILIQPDPSIQAPRHTLPAMTLVGEAMRTMDEPEQIVPVYAGERTDKAAFGIGAVLLGYLGGRRTVKQRMLGRRTEKQPNG